ncbi:hypothetical protein E3Q06_00430 [Wallemia mellicola]|nr:hypothetical protein E3Q21_00253 [Wallemia mellicola]TIB92084.1 hypothetical protein E3Q20_00426 [Wallemia mellicola]TIC43730.1 hypothetical protein E3Q07_00430 [Wallemia mellicola]TIC52794.1 hypothetical protein E3Q06_00430 [Wallemia mellicola]
MSRIQLGVRNRRLMVYLDLDGKTMVSQLGDIYRNAVRDLIGNVPSDERDMYPTIDGTLAFYKANNLNTAESNVTLEYTLIKESQKIEETGLRDLDYVFVGVDGTQPEAELPMFEPEEDV